jgi:RHS repeat-associated protein
MNIEWKNEKLVVMQAGGLLSTRRSEKIDEVHGKNPVRDYSLVERKDTIPPRMPSGMMSKTTDYSGNMVYENGTLKRTLIDGGYIDGGVYHYYLTDHLGNNRVVVNESGDIVQKNHYYPFGMGFADNTSPDAQPYKYNNKELDQMNGLNWYDNGARFYDPAFPHTPTMDRHAETYYSWSPYSRAANNPMRFVDPDGKDWLDKVKGAAAALIDNATVGLVNLRGSFNYNDAVDYNSGQNFGDALSIVGGSAEAASGLLEVAGGIEVETVSLVGAPATGGTSLIVTVVSAGAVIDGTAKTIHGTAMAASGTANLASQKGRVSESSSKSQHKNDSKREAREAGKEQKANQKDSEQRVKWKANELEKAKGPDARRRAHDAKEKGAPDRTKKQIDEDYKINR